MDEEQLHLGRDDELTMQIDPFVEDPSQEALMMMEDFGGTGMAVIEGFTMDVEQGRDRDGFLEPEVGRDHDATAQSTEDFGVSHDMSGVLMLDSSRNDAAKGTFADPLAGDYSFEVSRYGATQISD